MSFSPSRTNEDSDNAESELLRYKRLYSALQEQVNPTQKHVCVLITGFRSSTASTTQLGHGIRRLVSLFDDVADLVHNSDKYVTHPGNSDDEDDIELIDKSPDEISELKRHRARCHIGVTQVLTRLIPNFLNKIDATEPVLLQEFYSQLQAGANDARGDDVLKVRAAVAKWLNEQTPPPTPLLNPDSRSNRGIQHDVMGKLLCLIDFDWDDPIIRARLRNCEDGYNIRSSFFLHCLYQSGTGNIHDVEEGFLKTGLLVKVFKHIFTSPSSANASVEASENIPIGNSAGAHATHNAKRATRKDVSGCLHMEEKVTARAIAYAAVQLVFALSDAPHWTAVHSGFDYRAFYYFVVDFFEALADKSSKERVKELLSWWNRRVFPTKHSSAGSQSQQVTSNQTLAQQRAARAARNRLSGLV
ncbi:hypothetical protein JOM56_013414 [Amanita muscaria]